MTAYRDDAAALRHRLDIETRRAERAEAKLERYEMSREHTWNGDIALFIARCLLVATPLVFAAFYVLYFGLGVAMLGIFDDTRVLMAIFAAFTVPLFVAGPAAAYKLGEPSRSGWGLALFSFLYLFLLFTPVGLYGLAVILRGRVRDAVFGPLTTTGVRVAPVEDVEDETDTVDEALGEEEAELELEATAALRTSRSDGSPS